VRSVSGRPTCGGRSVVAALEPVPPFLGSHLPENAAPGSAEGANGVMVLSSGACSGVDVGGPWVPVAGGVGEYAELAAQAFVASPAEARRTVFTGLVGEDPPRAGPEGVELGTQPYGERDARRYQSSRVRTSTPGASVWSRWVGWCCTRASLLPVSPSGTPVPAARDAANSIRFLGHIWATHLATARVSRSKRPHERAVLSGP
jgi:hypothetical protein